MSDIPGIWLYMAGSLLFLFPEKSPTEVWLVWPPIRRPIIIALSLQPVQCIYLQCCPIYAVFQEGERMREIGRRLKVSPTQQDSGTQLIA